VKSDASEEEMLDAVRRASATELMERSGKGLDTRVGEGGVRVSGGERQRLSIARALLRNPRLFIFDEATSALDSITEQEITTAVRSVSSSREHMVILIAHRLSTIMHADTIYVLERGRIIEQGSHESLLQKQACISPCGGSRLANVIRGNSDPCPNRLSSSQTPSPPSREASAWQQIIRRVS
jgi:ATP-binding cassette subfamily B protein